MKGSWAGSQDGSREAGTEAAAMKEPCLAGLLLGAYPSPSQQLSTTHQSHTSELPAGQHDGGGNTSTESLSSQVTVLCVKLTRANQYS